MGMKYWDALSLIQAAGAPALNGRLAANAANDAAANAAANAPITGTAELWGKAIPVTWGRRRITGQLLQIGPQSQKTTTTQYRLNPAIDSDIIAFTGGWQSNLGTKTETKFHSTFAYCFGAPGNKAAQQILVKLWFNGQLIYDINAGQLSNEIRFRLYQGGEDQLPDEQLNSGPRSPYPVAYRGLIYIVFYDYSLANQTSQGNPTIEAEFAEQISNINPVTKYSTYGLPLSVQLVTPVIDAKKGVIYSAGNDGRIYKYNIAGKQLVSDYAATLPGATLLAAFTIFGFVRLNNTPYIFCTASGSNSRRLYMLNADTGACVAQFGNNSSSLTPSDTNVCASRQMHAYSSMFEGQQVTYLTTTDFFDTVHLFRVTANSFTFIKRYTLSNIRSSISAPNAASVPTIYSWVETTGDLYRDGVSWYTAPHTITTVFHCAFDDTLVIFSQNLPNWSIRKITREAIPVVKWEFTNVTHPLITSLFSAGATADRWAAGSATNGGQRIGWPSGVYVALLDMMAGSLDVVARSTFDTAAGIYDAFTNTIIYVTGTTGAGTISLSSFPIFQQSTANMLLSTFLHDVAVMQGYESANITIEGITDTIIGAAITQITDIDAMLDDIRRCYNFQIIKTGRFIRFTRRNYGLSLTVDAEYTEEQRAVLQDDDVITTVSTEMTSPAQTAGTIVLSYIDPDYNYTVVPFIYKRNDPQADHSVSWGLSVPIIMSAATAAALAARALVDDNASDTTQSFRLPQAGLAHEPGDLIELIYDEYSEVVRAVEISYNGDWSLSIKAEGVYTQEGPTYDVPTPILPLEPPSLLGGEGAPLILDTTLIRAADQYSHDALEIYLSAMPAGRLPIVGSSQINKSIDNAAMAPVVTLPDALSLGQLISTMSSGPVLQVNYDETLTFRLLQGDSADFHTDTLLNMLAGANRVLIGQAGRWEQVGYITAAYDSATKIVTLTGLVRGWRGTELFASLHQPGDYVLPVPDSAVALTSDLPSDLGKVAVYAVSDSMLRLNYADAEGATILGIARRPWAPYNVHAVAAGGDLGLSWKRRTRLSGPLNNGSGTVPLDEATEAYRLVIYRAGNAVRTVELTAPSFTYTAAMQTADGWAGAITSIQLDVTQISALVGPGFVKAGTYDVE